MAGGLRNVRRAKPCDKSRGESAKGFERTGEETRKTAIAGRLERRGRAKPTAEGPPYRKGPMVGALSFSP